MPRGRFTSFFAFVPITLAAVAVAVAASTLAGCGSGTGSAPETSSSGDALSRSTGYSGAAAARYADESWDDGVGECAEFTSDSLRAGHLNLPVITWVPDLVSALSSYDFEEHGAGTGASASAGDVVVFSDDAGDDFCQADDSDEANCGHVCLVSEGGASDSSILVDCHNTAHYRVAVADLLGGEYSYYRVYHLTSRASAGVEACTSDDDCNQGQSGTGIVCAAGEGYCIRGCHSDDDCSGGQTCAATSPHWSCQ